MSLPKYQKYRSSGADWLGTVPHHWDVHRLKTRFALRTEKTARRDNCIALENIEGWTGRFVATGSEFEGEGVAFNRGDVLFGKLRPYLAKVYLADGPGEAVGDFHVLHPRPMIDGRYAQYQMLNRSFIEAVDGSTFGSKMPRASWEALGGMPFVLPPSAEQTAIADFLDRETAKIDALIAEQEKLIALLYEKRQATVSQAVTRGLRPNRLMKDSGRKWLGQIPERWTVSPLMWLTDQSRPIMYGIVLPGPHVDEGVPIVKGGDVKKHKLRLELLNRTTFEIEATYARARLKPFDIVYSIRGSIGDAEVVSEELADANITQDVARVSPAPAIQTRWLLHVMKSKPIFAQLEQRSLGATIRGINIFELKRARVPVPPKAERDEIAVFLDIETTKLDALATEVERNIKLLDERRAALIAAAVTGQIDVRGAVTEAAVDADLAA